MQQLDKVVLWISRVGVFLMPFVPLIVASSMFFPFITGKNFAFRIIVEIIFAAWILLALRKREYRPRTSLLLYGFLSFLVVIGISDVLGENPLKSFWSNFERMEGYITLLHLFAYFIVAGSVLNTEKWWTRLFATSVGVSAFLGIYGILQLSGKIVINQGGVRLDGTFGNAAYFAGYMLFHVFLTLFLIFRHRINSRIKWLYGGALLLQLFVLYYSATRGAAVGLAGGLLLATILAALFGRENRQVRIGAISVAALVIILVGVLYASRNTELVKSNPVLTRFASISLESASSRFMVWNMAFQGFKENPVFGWGQENFNYAFNKYYTAKMWGQEQWFDRTHNIFFDWLIAGGLLGLLAYLSLYGFALFYLWRKAPEGSTSFSTVEKSILTALLAAYFIQNFFVFDNIGTYILFTTFLAFIHSRASEADKRIEGIRVLSSPKDLQIAGGAALVILILALYVLNIRPIGTAQTLLNALRQQSGIEKNLELFEKARKAGSLGRQEIAEQFLQTATSIFAAPTVDADTKARFTAAAEKTMRDEISRAPEDARLRLFMGSYLNRVGRFSDALPELQKAHELSFEKQAIRFELATALINLNKLPEALSVLKEGWELNREVTEALRAYAVAAIYAKDFKLVEELLVPVYGTVAVSDDRILKAYFDAKEYRLVLEIWKKRAAAEPTNPQYRVSLAAAYLLAGERGKAITELQEVIRLSPEATQEMEFYISEIRAGRNP